MKKILLSLPILLTASPVLAHAEESTSYGSFGMMGGTSMMGPWAWGGMGFLTPLVALTVWGLLIALLVGLVRWVWKQGSKKE